MNERISMKQIVIKSKFIKLDSLLKFAELVESGGMAKAMIQNNLVQVNNNVCNQRGKKIYRGDLVKFNGQELEIIGE